MENTAQVQPGKGQTWYTRLDRFLLYLLTAELGYFIFLMFAAVVVIILVYAVGFAPRLPRNYETSILWPVLVYLLALPLNMLGGLASITRAILARATCLTGFS